MGKKIVTVGVVLAHTDIDYVDFKKKASLLDWDIIIFRPDIHEFTRYDSEMPDYLGRRCLGDRNSFSLKEAVAHWRREINEAVEIGKTVIVHLCKPNEVFVQTGKNQFSGTGRNRQTTKIVEPFSNYEIIPAKVKWTASQGREMVVSLAYREILASYWERFGSLSTYEVTFEEATKDACLVTRHGGKAVALHIIGGGENGGNLLFLPDMDFDPENFFNSDDDSGDAVNDSFNDEARKFAACYVAEVVALDRTLRQGVERSVEPQWAKSPSYVVAEEKRVQGELLLVEEEIEIAQKKKDDLKDELAEAGQLRSLLFETGKPLENVILTALRTLGFEAENFQDDRNEFDAVFSSKEGRLLGEAEGKDSKAINITKLRQLTMNIEEDFEREEVETRAKGVLFGNAYRLTNPANRDAPFTEKCVTSAIAQSIALVHTPDLFAVTRYVMESADIEFAKRCREVMISSCGVAKFPTVPEARVELEQIQAAEFASAGASATL